MNKRTERVDVRLASYDLHPLPLTYTPSHYFALPHLAECEHEVGHEHVGAVAESEGRPIAPERLAQEGHHDDDAKDCPKSVNGRNYFQIRRREEREGRGDEEE